MKPTRGQRVKSNTCSESLDSKQLDIIQRIGGIGYWEYDPTEKSIFLPEASQELLASITGSPVDAPVPSMHAFGNGGRERLHSAFDQATASHLAFQVELQLFGSDGRPAWLVFRGAQVELAPGLLRLAGTFSDISGEKRREADHRQANVQLQALLDAQLASLDVERGLVAKTMSEHEAHFKLLTEDVADVVWKADSSMRITYISPVDQRLRGYQASEVLGRHLFEMLTEEGVATVLQVIGQSRQAELEGKLNESVTFEVQHRCKDGRLLWGEVQSRPVRDATGAITGYHGITRETTKRRQLEDQVRQLAFYDPLTHLPNRRLLGDRLNQSIAASQRNKCHCALLVLDLDNFKPLNDAHGHLVGDLLLIEAALRLRGYVRAVDTVARFGGDEFVVLLNDLDANLAEATAQAGMVAEKIRVCLSAPYLLKVEHPSQAPETVVHRCSASIGVVLYFGPPAKPEDIFKWADAAMYQAKAAGRNAIRFYDQGSL
jgi:diguanylate cyclase (GGDEF)-like protein/PAS domain S-box-containing protein